MENFRSVQSPSTKTRQQGMCRNTKASRTGRRQMDGSRAVLYAHGNACLARLVSLVGKMSDLSCQHRGVDRLCPLSLAFNIAGIK